MTNNNAINSNHKKIAIIGMAGRFPGADTVSDFWNNILNRVESIRNLSDSELTSAGATPELLSDPLYVKRYGKIEGIELFDASFFGINPREAELTDPQQRMFLECSWEAFEDAGYDPGTYPGSIGVFGGCGINYYLQRNILFNPDILKSVDEHSILIGNTNDYLTTRVSYKLNLRGPSFNIGSACSTSLVAVQTACLYLSNGICDIALTGGVSLNVPQTGYLFKNGHILSPDGHCRAFDATANGTVPGDGVGTVLLKRLDDAIRDQDHIYAIISGIAINNDGGKKIGFTAPSQNGQAEVIKMAHQIAGVKPDEISYVETHGTGTYIGDPIEFDGLRKAFNVTGNEQKHCALGAVKTNIGHLDSASGIAGLIKTAMALYQGIIPPSLHYSTPNPKVNIDNSPFYIPTEAHPWNSSFPKKAGISSFGLGGTNAHAILEEAPAIKTNLSAKKHHIIPLSAKTVDSLGQSIDKLVTFLKKNPEINVADMAFTLQQGRKVFPYKKALLCQTIEELIDTLQSLKTAVLSIENKQSPSSNKLIFMFSGQGTQYAGMTKGLYDTERVFKNAIDKCISIINPLLGIDFQALLYPETSQSKAALQLTETRFTQPALFTIEYALAQLFFDRGVKPAAMIGHSIGEYVAACIAGVFSLEDALTLVVKRALIMQEQPAGVMLSISATPEWIRDNCGSSLEIAVVNAPELCVVGGSENEIANIEKILESKSIQYRRLQTSHAFHTSLMQGAVEPFKQLCSQVPRKAPSIPFISNLSGTWFTAENASDPAYWPSHLRKSVQFSQGIQELASKHPQALFIEIGPGNTLSTICKQHASCGLNLTTVQTVRGKVQQTDDSLMFLKTIANIWEAGGSVDWTKSYPGEKRQRVSLPTYQFDRKRYWIEPVTSVQTAPEDPVSSYFNTSNNLHTSPKPSLQDGSVSTDQSSTTEKAEPASLNLETYLTELWQKTLGIKKISIDDNYLEIGGDSLFAIQIFNKINEKFNVHLPISVIMKYNTISAFAAYLKEITGASEDLSHDTSETIRRGPSANGIAQVEETIPLQHAITKTLSPAQKRLWFLCQFNKHTPAFNIIHSFRISRKLDIKRLENTLYTIVKRHQPLRSTFKNINGEPAVFVTEDINISLPVIECGQDGRNITEEIVTHIKKEVLELYDLENGPLYKFRLFRTGPNEHRLVFFAHHIVTDGWSMSVILNELSIIYNSDTGSADTRLPALKTDYFDYAAYMNKLEEYSLHEETVTFWKEYFKDGFPVLTLPTDFPRPKEMKYTAGLISFEIPAALTQKIEQFAKSRNITQFSIFMSVYALLLTRYSRQDRIVIGCPSAGRDRTEFEPLVGLFLNMIPIKITLAEDLSIEKLCEATYRDTINIFTQKSIQYGKLVELLHPQRELNVNPVFQTMFSYSKYMFNPDKSAAVEFKPETYDRGVSEYDLTIYIWAHEKTIYGAFEYSDELFLKSTIEVMCSQFLTLLEHTVNDPSLAVSNIPLFTETERAKQLSDKFMTDCKFPSTSTVHALIDKSLSEHGNSLAITDGTHNMSYTELYNLSNKVCNGLLKAGVSPGSSVGVYMTRSINIVPVLLGILKTGAAYIPLDPIFPAERIDYIANDAELKFIVTDVENRKITDGNKQIVFHSFSTAANDFTECSVEPPGSAGNGDDIAYILYTSGSTGKPKGVEIRHSSLVNFLMSMKKKPGIDKSDILLAVTSISFDISGLEIFLPLLTGAKIFFADSLTVSDAFELKKMIENSGATIMQATPATWRMLLDAGWTKGSGLKVLCGGEAMTRALADRILATGAELWNMYGPTETTIWSSLCQIQQGKTEPDIGAPIDNTQFFFLDDKFMEVPRGAIAELCIGGDGLANGYHKRPDLTKERFVTINYYGKNLRIYKTGDLVRVKADGTIEFLGRTDHQVKLRGYRIELGEIETLLEKHPSVSQAIAATIDKTTGKELVAYIRPNSGYQIDISIIREFLLKEIPHYMVPAVFVTVDEFIHTPNGKIDRSKLPHPEKHFETSQVENSSTSESPRDTIEKYLMQIWEKYIGKKVDSIDENYFELGGHSLLAVQIFNEIFNTYNLRLPLAHLIEYPTIRTFANHLRNLLHIPEPEKNPGVHCNNLRLGYTTQGHPAWYTFNNDHPDSFHPLSGDGPVPAEPFSGKHKTVPANPSQREIWKSIQANRHFSQTLNAAISVRLDGPVDTLALDSSIQSLPVIHEILRSHFSSDGKSLIIQPNQTVPVTKYDMTGSSDTDVYSLVNKCEDLEAITPFDLQRAPLLRCTIISDNKNGCIIIFGTHGSVIDGSSTTTLIRDFEGLYSSFTFKSAPCKLPLHNLSDYAKYQATAPFITRQQNAIFYWHSKLALPPLPKPYPVLFKNKSHQHVNAVTSHTVTGRLTDDIFHKTKLFARENKVSTFAVALAVFAQRIQKYTNSDDIITGITFAGQYFAEMDDLAGNFSSLLPVRIRASAGTAFSTLCTICHNLILNGGSNATIGIKELSEELGFTQQKTDDLVAIRVNYIKTFAPRIDKRITTTRIFNQVNPCAITADLELSIKESDLSLELIIHGRTDLTSKEWVDTFLDELTESFRNNCTVASKEINTVRTPPATENERTLSEIWNQILGITDSGIDSNFFELGGDSLSAIQLLNTVNSRFTTQLQMAFLTEQNTIRTMAAYLTQIGSSAAVNKISAKQKAVASIEKNRSWNTVVTFRREGNLPPFFCVSGLGGNPMTFVNLVKNLGNNQPFYALQYRGVDGILQPHTAVKDIASEFIADLLQVQPQGPFYIGGYSFGGLVAYEMIQQLRKNDHTIGGLVMIDTVIPQAEKWTLKMRLQKHTSGIFSEGPVYISKKVINRVIRLLNNVVPKNNQTTFIRRFDLVAQRNYSAGLQYNVQPITSDVIYIKSSIRIPAHLANQDAVPNRKIDEWFDFIPRDRLDIRFVETHHYELLNEPFVVETARNITEGLAVLQNRKKII